MDKKILCVTMDIRDLKEMKYERDTLRPVQASNYLMHKDEEGHDP
jgi:hypothetical protein